jgi:hypothetical protein
MKVDATGGDAADPSPDSPASGQGLESQDIAFQLLTSGILDCLPTSLNDCGGIDHLLSSLCYYSAFMRYLHGLDASADLATEEETTDSCLDSRRGAVCTSKWQQATS